MDFIPILSTCLILLFTLTPGNGLQIIPNRTPSGTLVIGDNSFSLTCTISNPNNADVFTTTLKRRRPNVDTEFITIVSFPAPSSSFNATYQDTTLESRTTTVRPQPTSLVAAVTFTDIVCTDKASYRWEVLYSDGEAKTATDTVEVDSLKALTNLKNDGKIDYSPKTNIKEGDEVTFVCNGTVGGTPRGEIAWYLYLNGATSGGQKLSVQTPDRYETDPNNACNNIAYSTINLRMTADMDGAVVRCTGQQDADSRDEFGDRDNNFVQTIDLSVFYGPQNVVIIKNPSQTEYSEGHEQLTLTCSASSKPEPSYNWVVPAGPDSNSTMTMPGAALQLGNLTEEDTGVYTCVVQNVILGQNYTVNTTVDISVQRTTTTTSTTTTPSSTDTTPDGGNTGGTKEEVGSASTSTTVIIVVCVLAAVLVIVIIVVIIVIKMRKNKKDAIEEPPEKPVRNNQDLSYYGNRPDLVSADHGMKNNTLNSSFNNSFDSSSDIKSRNEDGLNYIDLKFENKPGSRRPIQLIDNNHMQYADIAMPQV